MRGVVGQDAVGAYILYGNEERSGSRECGRFYRSDCGAGGLHGAKLRIDFDAYLIVESGVEIFLQGCGSPFHHY